MTIPSEIFREYDIRGTYPEQLNQESVTLIGQAIGTEIRQSGDDRVIIGRDGRLSGPILHEALKQGLLNAGCHVTDIGEVPTPLVYWATHHLDIPSGVMLTGSHNPSHYNGMKIVIDHKTLSSEGIRNLYARIQDKDLLQGQGDSKKHHINEDYIEQVAAQVSLSRPLHVVVDCGNGVAGGVAPALLRRIGAKVTELFCDIDGHFPNHHPDPTQPENLTHLIQAVKDYEADIGLGFDGDGDRLGIISNNGTIIWPDRLLILLAQHMLTDSPNGHIIFDVKCSRHLPEAIDAAGGNAIMWKTGHSLIKQKIKETNAILAGEMSGHIFINDRWYGFDDALYSAARVLEILSKEIKSCDEVFKQIPEDVSTPELKIAIEESHKQEFMEKFKQQIKIDNAKLNTIDGLRIDLDNGWGLIRPSNTTPNLVLRFEAENELVLNEIMSIFKQTIKSVDASLEVPF